jgi:outer membrane receptor protein involved in Fe transport
VVIAGLHRYRFSLAVTLIVIALGAPQAVRAQSAAASGAIRGRVVDADFQTPISRVQVTLLEAFLAASTNADGDFVFERVPPGIYTLSFGREGYERVVKTGISVGPGQVAEVNVEMPSEVVEMEELVVKGEDLLGNSEIGLLEIRAEAVTVQDAISSELISQAGATDAAGALKLVVGATVTDGKYATVRGLSDRYTGTTLNGVRLPSADPRKRAVNIDIFPTGTIESMTVTKTFTPDLQGDFTGGGVDIKTKSIPDETVMSMAVGAEYNTSATGNDAYLTYLAGGINASGFDQGERNLPDIAKQKAPPFPNISARPGPEDIANAAFYDELTRSFDSTIGTTEDAPGLNGSFSFLYGDGKSFEKGGKLGWLTGLTYQNKYSFYQDGINNTAYVSLKGQPMTVAKARTDSQGTQELLIGFLGSLAYHIAEGNDLTLRVVGNQSTEDNARFQIQNVNPPIIEQNQSLQYVERSLGSAQLSGVHVFKKVTFDWLGAFNLTRQDEPDVRFFRNWFDPTNLTSTRPSNSTDALNTRRIFREIDEHNGQGAGNVTIPIKPWHDLEGRVKAGAYYESSHRDYTQYSFSYTFPRQAGSQSNAAVRENNAKAFYTGADAETLWTDVFLDPTRIGLADNDPPAPNQLLWTIQPLGTDVDYTGEQTIEALYAMAEIPVTSAVKVIGGARWESTDLGVVPINRAFGRVEIITIDENGNRGIAQVPQELAIADISESDVLPSVGAIWTIRPHMDVRGSWAKTVARPTFRELAPVATEEFIFGDEFVGNPDLILSSVTNWDLRWEWFRRPGDVLAASVFAKQLENPIEVINFSAANRSFVEPINYEKGSVRGIEVEARTTLDVLHPALKHLSAGGNATWLDSSVDVPESEQEPLSQFGIAESTRALQGQPKGVVNLNLTYDDDDRRISAGLFYTAIGETLVSGSATGLDGATPNVYQRDVSILDATFSKGFRFSRRGSFSLTAKAKNLLAPDAITIFRTPYKEEEIRTRRETARLFSVTLGWTY